jgi:hypothetical protein
MLMNSSVLMGSLMLDRQATFLDLIKLWSPITPHFTSTISRVCFYQARVLNHRGSRASHNQIKQSARF